MAVVEEMKRVAEEIVLSYQSRISTVATIIDDTYQLLDDFKIKRNEMNNQLKETLARQGFLRKKDFDDMMRDILSHQDEREKHVKELLKTFFEEQKEIAEIIKKSLTEGEKVRIGDFKNSLKDIQVRQKARENEVSVMLKEFQTEYKEMTESLRSLLDKRETIRVNEFKVMLKDIRSRQIGRAKEVRTPTPIASIAKDKYPIGVGVMAEKRAEGGEVREKEEVAQGK